MEQPGSGQHEHGPVVRLADGSYGSSGDGMGSAVHIAENYEPTDALSFQQLTS